MSYTTSILLLAVGASAYVDDYTLDKMVNRAKSEEDLERDLDDSVLAKGAGESPTPKAAPTKVGGYKNTAYKNGEMGPNRVWKGYEEAADIANKIKLDFDPGAWFRAASPRLINEELALGETGTFGEKQKFYAEDGTPKALPGAPALQPTPFVQRGFTPYASMKMPNTMRGRVQATRVRAPFLASADTVSIFGFAMVGLFAGCVLALVLFHRRSRSILTQ